MTAAPPTPAKTSRGFARRSPALIVTALLLAVGVGIAGAGAIGAYLSQNPSLLLMVTPVYVIYTVLVVLILFWLVPWQRPTWWALTMAFLWGFLVVASLQLMVNGGIGQLLLATGGVSFYNAWAPAFSGSFTEEALKAAGVLLALAISTRAPRTPSFVFLIGATVGLGFQVFENLNVTLQYAQGTVSTNWEATSFILLNRAVLLGALSHVMYTGIFGLGLGYFLTADRGLPNRLLALIAGALFAVSSHFVNNSPYLKEAFPDSPVASLLKGAVFFAGFVVAMIWMVRNDNRYYKKPFFSSE